MNLFMEHTKYMTHLKKYGIPPLVENTPCSPSLGEAKRRHWPLLGMKSVKYPVFNLCECKALHEKSLV